MAVDAGTYASSHNSVIAGPAARIVLTARSSTWALKNGIIATNGTAAESSTPPRRIHRRATTTSSGTSSTATNASAQFPTGFQPRR
jgi:hypothetical protein